MRPADEGLGRQLRGSGVPPPSGSRCTARTCTAARRPRVEEDDGIDVPGRSLLVLRDVAVSAAAAGCRALCKDSTGATARAPAMVASAATAQGWNQWRRPGGTCVGTVGSGCEDWWSSSLASMSSVPSPTAPATAGASTQTDGPPPPPEPIPPRVAAAAVGGDGEVCCCVTSQPGNGHDGLAKPIASARRWLLANHLKLIREPTSSGTTEWSAVLKRRASVPRDTTRPSRIRTTGRVRGLRRRHVHRRPCFCACQCLSGVPTLKSGRGGSVRRRRRAPSKTSSKSSRISGWKADGDGARAVPRADSDGDGAVEVHHLEKLFHYSEGTSSSQSAGTGTDPTHAPCTLLEPVYLDSR